MGLDIFNFRCIRGTFDGLVNWMKTCAGGIFVLNRTRIVFIWKYNNGPFFLLNKINAHKTKNHPEYKYTNVYIAKREFHNVYIEHT